MTNVVEVLEQEHQVIQKAVELMARFAREIEAGNEFEAVLLAEIVQFMRTFAEQCHHGKEEKALFSLLEKKGVPANGCPIAALVGEHRHAHELLNQLEAASARYNSGDETARPVLLDVLTSLVKLYRQHIWKEEYLLFPLANKMLTTTDYEELSKQFDSIASQIGTDVHHAMETMVDSIGQRQEVFPLEDDSLAAPECSVCGS